MEGGERMIQLPSLTEVLIHRCCMCSFAWIGQPESYDAIICFKCDHDTEEDPSCACESEFFTMRDDTNILDGLGQPA